MNGILFRAAASPVASRFHGKNWISACQARGGPILASVIRNRYRKFFAVLCPPRCARLMRQVDAPNRSISNCVAGFKTGMAVLIGAENPSRET
jgi:hypothetical protein